MEKSFLQQAVEFFASFGEIKSRSMFGGFGIFCDDAMFALVVNDELHLRAANQNEEEFKSLGMQPYCYSKRGFPVVTKYYAIPSAWWENKETLVSHAKLALEIAVKDQKAKKVAKPTRIKDLPNLRLSTERMLKKAGIDSVEKLIEEGSVGAFMALKQTHGKSINIDMLWALEGALTNTHWNVITPQRRDELLASLN